MNRPIHGFYVYELVDPRDDSVFYVGKGCGNRDRTTLSTGNIRKRQRITEIKAAGLDVQCRRIAEDLYGREALRIERKRIAEIGVANLTNHYPGNRTQQDALTDAVDFMLNRMIPFPEDASVSRKLLWILVRCQLLLELLRIKAGMYHDEHGRQQHADPSESQIRKFLPASRSGKIPVRSLRTCRL